MPITKTTGKSSARPVSTPLIIVLLVLLLIGVGMFISRKAQQSDPTLTAAPVSGHPGNIIQASPEKMAKERQIQAKMNAEVAAMKAQAH